MGLTTTVAPVPAPRILPPLDDTNRHMHGYWVLHEACVQLRGDAGDRQVPGGPEVAIVSAGGGPIAGCVLLTR